MTKKNKSIKRVKIERPLVGWKEWCALPSLGPFAIEAKVDTGANTSALHAKFIKQFERDGKSYLSFRVFIDSKNQRKSKVCEALLVARRFVMSSNGEREKRYVIRTPIKVGETEFETEITLTDRSPLRYRMLLGRLALRRRFLIDPGKTHMQGIPKTSPRSGA